MPTTYQTPGIYVTETAAAPTTVSPATTHATAFIGAAVKGPVNRAVRVSSLAEYATTFGPLRLDLELGYAVLQYFQGGGTALWLVRIARDATAAQWERALANLDAVSELNLLALPGISAPHALNATLAYAQRRRAFLILDAPREATTFPALLPLRGDLPQTPDAAIYLPWITISDPLSPGRPRLSAPSGSVAAVYAKTDALRGVWKAPAGLDATLDGAIGPALGLTDSEIGQLNPHGLNAIRLFAGPDPRVVVWGARTLAGDDTVASEWKYVPVRRTALFLRQSLEQSLTWTVFEPNDEALWARIRFAVENFLQPLFRAGAFSGASAKEGYFVKCDRETTTAGDQSAGFANLVIGFAPSKPAEFIVLKLSLATQPSG